jgi:hypothetical protein
MFYNGVLLPVLGVLIVIFLKLFATGLPIQRKNPVNTYKMYEFYNLVNVVNIQ